MTEKPREQNDDSKKSWFLEKIHAKVGENIHSILEFVPWTDAHAKKKVESLFSSKTFDHDQLTTGEAWLLSESINDKYIPSIKEGARSRYHGLIIWTVAPYEFLLLGLVLLSASANSTTGAWYSITLKEMKQKFEWMWMSLTTKLLWSDISANALATYAGIWFAYKALIFNNLMAFAQNPTVSGFVQLAGWIWVTALIHSKLEWILSRKEDASIQFDFNDATLAGMTEEQQKFFSKSINEVTQSLERLSGDKSNIELGRVIYGTMKSLVDIVKVFDVEGRKNTEFSEIYKDLADLENNFKAEIDNYFELPNKIFDKLSVICDFSESLKIKFKSYSELLSFTADNEEDRRNAVIAGLHEIIPLVMGELEDGWEKIILED